MALCSISDIRERTSTPLSDGALMNLIEAVSDEIEDYVGAWLEPRDDATLLFDVERIGSALWMQQGDRRVGVRAVTALGVATTSQPGTGGTYTSIPAADVMLRPRPAGEAIASQIVLSAPASFRRGYNTVSVTGSFGPARVAPRVRETAIALVLFDLENSRGVTSETIGDWSTTYADEGRGAILEGLSSLMTVAV